MHAPQTNKALQAMLMQALQCQEHSDMAGAERWSKKALRKFPASCEALEFLGALAAQQSKLDDARDLLERALRIQPKSAHGHAVLGAVLGEQNDTEGALVCFERSLQIEPGQAEIHFNIGNALSDLGRHAEAIDAYEQAVTIRPAFSAALRNQGILLLQLGRYDEALDRLNQALALDPDLTSAVFARGKTFLAMGRADEALIDCDKAAVALAGDAEVHNVRGIVLQKTGRFSDALHSFRLAAVLRPDHAGAYWNEGLCRLTLGDWSPESWQLYEWGWALGQRQPVRRFEQPRWSGKEDIAGKTIFLHDEQGLGDTIQFARFAASVAARGARVILQVQPSLKRLMSSMAGPHQVIAEGDDCPSFDYHCPLLSLPLGLGITLDNLPSSVSYLSVDVERLATWRTRLGGRTGLRIGIVWRGSPLNMDDCNRSIPLRELLTLASSSVQLVCLQKVLNDEELSLLSEHRAVLHFETELEDFSDTAALIMQMDVVISVCTSVAHLSAALGQSTWIPLSYAPDWRWLRERTDSPWYPTARLFRQTTSGTWRGVIDELRLALLHLQGLDHAIVESHA